MHWLWVIIVGSAVGAFAGGDYEPWSITWMAWAYYCRGDWGTAWRSADWTNWPRIGRDDRNASRNWGRCCHLNHDAVDPVVTGQITTYPTNA